MDLVLLRQLVGDAVASLAMYTHKELAGRCAALGLPEPPGESEGTKRQRVDRSFAALPDAGLPAVAEQILTSELPLRMGAPARNAIQDVLWAGQDPVEVPKRTRREIARDLDLASMTIKPDRFMALLDRLWVLDTPLDPWTQGVSSLRADIERHVFRNPGDWSAEDLLEQLGAYEAGDARFGKFLEGLACAEVIPDEPAQRHIVGILNPRLRTAGAELRETGTDGGYPVFSLVSTRTAPARPGGRRTSSSPRSPSPTSGSPMPSTTTSRSSGTPTRSWSTTGPSAATESGGATCRTGGRTPQQITRDEEAKRSLYHRLARSLPASSPPQRNLFDLYHEIHRSAVPDLPALLPEIWLHWDHKTARERGRDALLRFRMDFLFLLPHGQRVVLEVDGSRHFTSDDGQPDAARYASGVRADRDLKLSGYEVFRFGATELQDREAARTMLRQFFADLFRRFGVTPAPG